MKKQLKPIRRTVELSSFTKYNTSQLRKKKSPSPKRNSKVDLTTLTEMKDESPAIKKVSMRDSCILPYSKNDSVEKTVDETEECSPPKMSLQI